MLRNWHRETVVRRYRLSGLMAFLGEIELSFPFEVWYQANRGAERLLAWQYYSTHIPIPQFLGGSSYTCLKHCNFDTPGHELVEYSFT